MKRTIRSLNDLSLSIHSLVDKYGHGSFDEKLKAWANEAGQSMAEFEAAYAKHRSNAPVADFTLSWWPPLPNWSLVTESHLADIETTDGQAKAYRAVNRGFWVPPELAPAKRPKINLPLPLPNHALTLPEKYAVLFAIYVAFHKGSETNSPWGTSLDACSDKPKELEGFIYFEMLLKQAKQVPSDSIAFLLEMRRDVIADLRGRAAATDTAAIGLAGKLTQGQAGNRKGRTDTEPDTGKQILPDNPDVADLCKLLSRDLPKGKGKLEIAKELTRGNQQKAESLLRQARRYKHLWPQPDRRTRNGQ